MIKLKYCVGYVAQPDGSEGTLTVEWFSGKDRTRVGTSVGCVVKNNNTFKELTSIKEAEGTKYYAYTKIPSISNKADISVHRFTKPRNKKNCTVEDVENEKVSLSNHEYIFVPCEHPKFDSSCFLEKYSISVRNTLSPHAVCNDGKVLGLCKEGDTERLKLLKFFNFKIKRRKSNANDSFYIEENDFDKLEETGPLLIGSGESKTLVGYYRKSSENHIVTISTFRTDTETIDVYANLVPQDQLDASLSSQQLESCLPDFQDKVFGREEDINHIKTLIQGDKKPCVVLTGGPGFGKTTVAINLAHKLKADKVVIFVSLREMFSIEDICSTLLAKVGQHPKEKAMIELIEWARSLKEEVLLILDNAEYVLQSSKDEFCGLLENLRSTNSKFLQFLITSRENFLLSTMEVTCQEIKELSEEKAGIDVICSMVSESNESSAKKDSEALIKLFELCGGIPLALRMIGSLLNDVQDINSLIEELKSFPMKTLENAALTCYHQSIRRAFEYSFARLDDILQKILVRLSVFRGSFSQEAASAIFQESQHVGTVQILNKLSDKSLLRKLDSKRYEMHSLIQKYLEYLVDVNKELYRYDFENASNEFVDYFVSLTKKGHDMFWSKDKHFKSSIEMFRIDNMNIENTLKKCYKESEKMKTFFPIVWSISMYLEMCISMEKLTKFLESCCTSAADQNEKGAELEARCLLGYYDWKRAGNLKIFREQIKKAKQLYEVTDLSQSQKWVYNYSYGMFLDQQKRKKRAKAALEVTKEAVQIAKNSAQIAEKISVADSSLNPPNILMLLLAENQLGIIEKHLKIYDEAEAQLKKSHDKSKELLGEDHILSIPKDLADLYLQQGKCEEALELYQKGLDTYKANGMNNEKQCIYLLKNMGSCCFNLRKVEKSLKCFDRAIELSERRLKGDQAIKVKIYSEIANVYYEEESTKPNAREYAQRALEMAERLQMNWFGKKQMTKIVN